LQHVEPHSAYIGRAMDEHDVCAGVERCVTGFGTGAPRDAPDARLSSKGVGNLKRVWEAEIGSL
jgi:hypothetical protein